MILRAVLCLVVVGLQLSEIRADDEMIHEPLVTGTTTIEKKGASGRSIFKKVVSKIPFEKSCSCTAASNKEQYCECCITYKRSEKKTYKVCSRIQNIKGCDDLKGLEIVLSFNSFNTSLTLLEETSMCKEIPGSPVPIAGCLEPFGTSVAGGKITICLQLSVELSDFKLGSVDVGCLHLQNKKITHTSSTGKERPDEGMVNEAWAWIKGQKEMFINLKNKSKEWATKYKAKLNNFLKKVGIKQSNE